MSQITSVHLSFLTFNFLTISNIIARNIKQSGF